MFGEVRRPLRLGMIGGGLNSAVGKAHRSALEMDGNWTLVSGAFSRDKNINVATGLEFGVERNRIYDTAEAMIEGEGENIDCVLVLSPTPYHAEHVTRAIEAGLSVICEKALATTSSECDNIKSLANLHKRNVFVTYNYSAYPMVRAIATAIRRGRVGDVLSIDVRMPQEGFLRRDPEGNPPSPQEWRKVDQYLPTVSLDLGVHVVHLAHFLTTLLPVRVACIEGNQGLVPQVIDYVSAIGVAKNGAAMNISFGKVMLGQRNGLEIAIYGTNGSYRWLQSDPERAIYSDESGRISMEDRSTMPLHEDGRRNLERFKVGHPSGFVESIANLYVDFAESFMKTLGSHESYVYGAAISADILRALEAMHVASLTNSWVTVSQSPESVLSGE